jgi:hypothetical protein
MKSTRRQINMSVQIIINGENAKESLMELSALAAGLGQTASASNSTPVAQPSAPIQAPTQAPVQHPSYEQQPVYNQQPPVQQPAPYQPPPVQQAPVQQAPVQQAPAQPTVPVSSAPTYTVEQLGVAAGPLVDAGRGPELSAWLSQRGASALMQLDKAYYGEFAMYLRSLGAKI